jgi:hypothetical protein
MIGGILGLCLTVYFTFFSSNSIMNPAMPVNYKLFCLLIFLFIFVLYTLSFIAGFFLWKKKQKGIILSIIVQIFQIPYIVAPGFIYFFISGLQLGATVAISSNVFKVTGLFYLGSSFNVNFGSSIKYIILGVNCIPVAVIYYIRRIQKVAKSNKLKEENEVLNDVNNISIGETE